MPGERGISGPPGPKGDRVSFSVSMLSFEIYLKTITINVLDYKLGLLQARMCSGNLWKMTKMCYFLFFKSSQNCVSPKNRLPTSVLMPSNNSE